MVLPANIQAGTPDPAPSGVFLIPLCTTREAMEAMIYALDSAYVQSRNLLIIKDFLNALQYISNPQDAMCMAGIEPEAPQVEVETDGDCQRVLIDGIPVTDWICSEEIENPPENPPVVGAMGFTMEELEEMMGCLNLTDSLKWENGVLYYRTCDGWKPVPGISGSVQTNTGNAAAQWDFDQWQEAGEPPLNEPASEIHLNDLYTTMDSLKCAKATALVDEIWNVLTIGDAVEDANGISAFITGLTSSLSGLGWIGAGASIMVALGYSFANTIWAIATGDGLASYANKLQSVYNNGASKDELTCELVDLMEAPVKFGGFMLNKMTAADVKIGLEKFREIVPHDEVVWKTLKLFPVQGWIDVVRPKVSETDCGCNNYLPYTPPAENADLDWYDHFGMTSKTGAGSSWVWRSQDGTAQAADTTASSSVDFLKTFGAVEIQPTIAKLGKVLIVEILTRSGVVVGGLPPQEGGVQFGIGFGQVGGGGSTTYYTTPFYNQVGVNEIDLEPIFAGWGGANPDIAIREITAKFQYWMDSGESVNIGVGRVEIVDATP